MTDRADKSASVVVSGACLCVTGTLVALACVLGVYEVRVESSKMSEGLAIVDVSEPVDVAARRERPADDLILIRPIFFPSRKPWEPPVFNVSASPVLSEAPSAPDPTFVVEGVALGEDLAKVLLRRTEETQGRWLQKGDTLDGWAVAEFDASGVILVREDRRFMLQIYPMGSFFSKLSRHPRLNRRLSLQLAADV